MTKPSQELRSAMPEETKPRKTHKQRLCESASRHLRNEDYLKTHATEETKPVEREAFDEWFSEEFEELNPLGQEARALRMVWDAALERAAAKLRELSTDMKLIFRTAYLEAADEVEALKGSR